MSVHFEAPILKLSPYEGFYPAIEINSKDTKGSRCKFCFREFFQNSHLQIHLRYQHRTQENLVAKKQEASNLICPVCSKTFQSEQLFNIHRQGCPKPEVSCQTCKGKFASRELVRGLC